MTHAHINRVSSRGFTLVEMCVVVGICATVASQAVPALGDFRQRQLLRATAEALSSDLRLARSEAARLSDTVFFRISGKGAQACYVLYTGVRNDCDCANGQAVCRSTDSAVIKSQWLPSTQPVRVSSTAETLQFQHRQGLVTQTGSIELSLASGTAIRQVVAITGRVRSCSPEGAIGGMPKCA